jgi:hypothetical protein
LEWPKENTDMPALHRCRLPVLTTALSVALLTVVGGAVHTTGRRQINAISMGLRTSRVFRCWYPSKVIGDVRFPRHRGTRGDWSRSGRRHGDLA